MDRESDIIVASVLCYLGEKQILCTPSVFPRKTRSFGRENLPFWGELIFLRGILGVLLASATGYGDG